MILDYASPISASAIKNSGADGAIRYLSWLYDWGGATHSYPNPKVITRTEYDGLTRAGVEVFVVWEYDAEDWLTGTATARAQATEATRQARALGYPEGAVIFGACDMDITWSQWVGGGHAYAQAWRDTIAAHGYEPGVYGPWDVLAWCANMGYTVLWQAGLSTAWSGGRNATVYSGAWLVQASQRYVGGIQCDVNTVRVRPPGSNYQGGGMATDPELMRRTGNADTYLYDMAREQDPITGVQGADYQTITPGVPNLPLQRAKRIEQAAQAAADGVAQLLGRPAPGTVALTDADRADLADAIAWRIGHALVVAGQTLQTGQGDPPGGVAPTQTQA